MTELISLNSESATNRLVLLHGWGADAHDLMPIGKLLTDGLKDPFEIILKPSSLTNAFASGIKPVLSETLSRAIGDIFIV